MAGPWTKYAATQAPKAATELGAAPAAGGPWAKYQAEPGMVPTEFGMKPANEVFDIVGGTPEAAAPANPSLFRMDSDFRDKSGVGMGDMLWASAKDMFGSRGGAAEYLAGESGGKVVMDADGTPLVELGDGTRYRMNDAGFDSTDLGNITGNVAAAFLPASWMAKAAQARNIGLGGRAALQGVTAGTTEAALQAGFDNGRVDPMRTSLATVGGAGGEVLGVGLGAIGNRVQGAVRNMTGANNQQAAGMLGELGAEATPEAVKRLAPNLGQLDAGADPKAIMGGSEFGFDYTLGQRLMDGIKKFQQTSKEEALRQTPQGSAVFGRLRETNAEKLDTALTGMGEKFGSRAASTPAEMVQGAAGGLKKQADDLSQRITAAYEAAGEGGRTAIRADAVATVPTRLRDAVKDMDIHPTLTPATSRALDQVQEATSRVLSDIDGGNVTGVTLKAMETQRRILNNFVGTAANPTDKRGMMAIKGEFDAWMDDAIDTALASGDPASLAAIKQARGLRAEYGRRFEGKGDADKFIAGLLDGTKTPEELLNVALGSTQVSKAAGSRFIERLRIAAKNDPEVMGSLRGAHFDRLTRGTDGNPLDMGKIIRNVRQSEHSNESVVKALYSPQQWAEIKRLADALQPLVAKGDFAKSSGTAERMARMTREMMGKMGGRLVGNVWEFATGGLNTSRAKNAITAPVTKMADAVPGSAPMGAQTVDEMQR